MEATFAQIGSDGVEGSIPELSVLGRGSNAFARVGVCPARHAGRGEGEPPADFSAGKFGGVRYTTVRRTSTLPRVALE